MHLKKTNLYTTVEDFQSAVNMDIRQGNRLIASQNTLLGEFLLEGLSHKLKGQVNIEGSIIIDQNGILTGEAKDLDTNSYKKIEIKEYMVLSQDQINFMKSNAAKFLSDDKKYILKVQLKDKIERIFYDSTKYLNELEIKNSQDLINEIKDIYELSKYKEKSIEELEEYISRIEYIYKEKSKSTYCEKESDGEIIKDPFE